MIFFEYYQSLLIYICFYLFRVHKIPIHAIITPEKWNNMTEPVVEGHVYEISEFLVRESRVNIRPLSTTKCIVFTPSTVMHSVMAVEYNIPVNYFQFTPIPAN